MAGIKTLLGRGRDFRDPAPFRPGIADPTFYVQLAQGMALSGAWNMQVASRTTDGGALDLAHFERHQVKLRFNSNF